MALFGDYTRFTGMSRYLTYRWFTDPAQRAIYPPEDRDIRGRVFTVELRRAYTADPAGTAGEDNGAIPRVPGSRHALTGGHTGRL